MLHGRHSHSSVGACVISAWIYVRAYSSCMTTFYLYTQLPIIKKSIIFL